ncbi:hypothetical protein CV102_10275 [Natronococcus pandeyae]|uniref:Methyltransferase FkbM domain-containing protein n=1 Tax=Natronococcus pandeyae TaxID=2055836 RepID=A0A8J8Q4Q0_9EURY|nr:FkbM family methyltransferase [Natronococcus pandeyae]TYL38884.1 hypothetical protein CV102_10275 [Natronococcus pandeyae]
MKDSVRTYGRLFQDSPVFPVIKRFYLGFENATIRAKIALGDDTTRLRVGGAEASFYQTSVVEWKNVNYYVEPEYPVLVDLVERVRLGDVFYDVGANVGIYSCLVADVLEEGSVVAFEPHRPTVERLVDNARLNGVDLTVVERALSNRSKRARLIADSDKPGMQYGTVATDASDPDTGETRRVVETVSGDELVRNGDVPPPDIIKIDVEGTAPAVLEGLEESIAESCRLVYVEPHDNMDVVRDRLRGYGFSIEEIPLARFREHEPPTLLGRK